MEHVTITKGDVGKLTIGKKDAPTFRCEGPWQLDKEGYRTHRIPCGKSLDKVIDEARKDGHTHQLTCPCPHKLKFQIRTVADPKVLEEMAKEAEEQEDK